MQTKHKVANCFWYFFPLSNSIATPTFFRIKSTRQSPTFKKRAKQLHIQIQIYFFFYYLCIKCAYRLFIHIRAKYLFVPAAAAAMAQHFHIIVYFIYFFLAFYSKFVFLETLPKFLPTMDTSTYVWCFIENSTCTWTLLLHLLKPLPLWTQTRFPTAIHCSLVSTEIRPSFCYSITFDFIAFFSKHSLEFVEGCASFQIKLL